MMRATTRPLPGAEEEERLTTAQVPLATALFDALGHVGARLCFGVPGDYALPLFRALQERAGDCVD